MTTSLSRAAALLYLLALAFPAFADEPPHQTVLADAATSDGNLATGLSAPGTVVRQSACSSLVA